MEYRFEVYADYLQFYLQDDDDHFDELSNVWTNEDNDKLLMVRPHLIGIGTARYATVPVIVRICEGRPDIADAGFDRVNACSIKIETGRLVINGCTEDLSDAARIEVAPGTYDVLIGYQGLETLSEDRSEGDDSYHVFLWRR